MKKRLKVKWGNVAKIVISMYLIVGVVGIFTSTPYTKDNGNVCRGYDYNIQVCSGDYSLE